MAYQSSTIMLNPILMYLLGTSIEKVVSCNVLVTGRRGGST